MIDSPTYRMAEALAGNDLPAVLADFRTVRQWSFTRIARELYSQHGIDVTAQTVKNWCDTLGIAKAG